MAPSAPDDELSPSFRPTPISRALWGLLTRPEDHEAVTSRLRTELIADSRLWGSGEEKRRKAHAEIHRAERVTTLAVWHNLVTRQFMKDQGPKIADSAWGTTKGGEIEATELAAELAQEWPGMFDTFATPQLRDAHLSITRMFYTAATAVAEGLAPSGEYAKFSWLPQQMATNATNMALYNEEHVELKNAKVRSRKGIDVYQSIVEMSLDIFENEANNPIPSANFAFAVAHKNLIGLLTAWSLPNVHQSPEELARDSLRNLRRIAMPAGHEAAKANEVLPDPLASSMTLAEVTADVTGAVKCGRWRTKREASTSSGITLNEVAARGDRHCSGHQLGPAGGVAGAAVADSYYRALARAITPADPVEVGDTPNPDTGLRDRGYFRPTEGLLGAYTVGMFRTGATARLREHRRLTSS